MFKTTFQKDEPKALIYCDFIKFKYTSFQSELISKLNSRGSDEYCTSEKSFVEVLDKPKGAKFFVVTKNLMLIKHCDYETLSIKKQIYEI